MTAQPDKIVANEKPETPAVVEAKAADAAKVATPKVDTPAAEKAAVEKAAAAKPAPTTPEPNAKPPVAKAEPAPKQAVKAVSAPAKPVAKPAKKTRTKTKPASRPAPAPKATKSPPRRAAQMRSEMKTMTDANRIKDDMKSTADAANRKAQATMADMTDRTSHAMERSARMVEEVTEFNKGNIEAMVESSKAVAKNAEMFGQNAAEYGRKSYEHASATVKEMASVKSPTDLLRLQSDYARQAFDAMVSQSSRNSELMLKAAGEMFQPLSNRLAVAAEKIKVNA